MESLNKLKFCQVNALKLWSEYFKLLYKKKKNWESFFTFYYEYIYISEAENTYTLTSIIKYTPNLFIAWIAKF